MKVVGHRKESCMGLENVLLLLILFILLSLFARIEAVYLAGQEWLQKGGERRVRLHHYVAGLAFALNQVLLFVLLVPWAVWKWGSQRRRRR